MQDMLPHTPSFRHADVKVPLSTPDSDHLNLDNTFFIKATSIKKLYILSMNYVIAVLPDRIQAEAAYVALEKEGIKATILGKGYKTADEFGLIDPNEQTLKQTRLMAFWLVPFGFIAGVTFSLQTDLDTFAWAGEIGNHIIGGLLGAVGGAMGSVFVGGGVGALFGNSDSLPYRNRLNAGKYLVVVQGSETLTSKTTRLLRRFDPEDIQNVVSG